MKHILLSLLLVCAFSVVAETPEEKGLAIAKEQEQRDLGWKDAQANMTMTLIRSKGRKSVRTLRSKMLEGKESGDKSLTIFDEPKDVRGTAFLTHSHALEPDDQWLFLPALNRVKRISSKRKTGRFMGSEFTYEDMASFEVEKYDFRYLRDEKLNGLDCFVVESFPKDEYTGYSRLVSYIDKAEYRVQKVDFYDKRKGRLLKTMEMQEYKHFLGKYWRPMRSTMTNHSSGRKTVLEWSDYTFGNGYTENDFLPSILDRVR